MVKFKSIKKWFKYFTIFIGVLALMLTITISFAYKKQDGLVQKALADLNEGFTGEFSIRESHISPFENFPYVSIDLKDVEIYETKSDSTGVILHIQDVYVGFDLWSVISGTYKIKKLKLSDGYVKLVQHTDGSVNVISALSSKQANTISEASSALNMSLEAIEMENIDLLKINEANNILAEIFIEQIVSSFAMNNKHIKAEFDSKMLFNLIIDGDTSFLHEKKLSLSTGIDYDLTNGLLDFAPSELQIEKAFFLMDGSIDVANDLNLALEFSGQKPNFDLFLAFVPEEYAPLLNRYENGGRIFFDASVNGSAAFGQTPHVEVKFGCEKAFVENIEMQKEVNDLFFKGHFTTGELNIPETMVLQIEDFTARPETGTFKGGITVKNFESPDIQMQLNSEFNLDFLIDFFNIENLQGVSGKVALNMNFHDIIDLKDPSKAIERLNESYYTELRVEDLAFTSTEFPLPFKGINIHAAMDGHKAEIDEFTLQAGGSDISITASISDLPAIIHHTNIPVAVVLDIRSNLIDIQELTKTQEDSTGFNEQIKDLKAGFRFNSTARAFTESPNLPLGEFFISELNAQLANYPHKLHDFNADLIIDSTDFNVIDFTGMLDESDFHFNGTLKNYDLWFDESPQGDTRMDFDLDAELIQLKDVFSYGGENYVPEDYREEEIQNLKLHGVTNMRFDRKRLWADLKIDNIEARLKDHGIRFEGFKGHVYIDSTHLEVNNLGGKLGDSEFTANLYYNLDTTGMAHKFSLKSPHLDFDQLLSYIPASPEPEGQPVDHEAGFNIFDLPFPKIHYEFDIDHLNYHRYLLDDFVLKGRMQPNHFLFVDSMAMKTAGGEMQLKGYFDGTNPDSIYFSPDMRLSGIDLDQLLFKFDNFGQDQLVSSNLKGRLSGTVKGIIHMHPDLIPATDISELEMGIEVLNGSLINFTAFEAMKSYFTDKNLKLVRFDTLKNTLRLKNGDLIIPEMNINTSLGYFELSGRQGMDMDMNYNMRIPLKVVARAGIQKLFGTKNRDTSGQVDDIQYRDKNRRTPFITVNISGTPDDYKVSLGKRKN